MFKGEIGQSNINPIKIMSQPTRPVLYQLKINNFDGDNFFLESGAATGTLQVPLAPINKGVDFTVPVKFDPSILGECKANLEISDKDIGT